MKKRLILLLALAALASCKNEPLVKPCKQLEIVKAPKLIDPIKRDTIIIFKP